MNSMFYSEHFGKADTSYYLSHNDQGAAHHATMKDGDVIVFNTAFDLAQYNFSGDDVERIYLSESDYDTITDELNLVNYYDIKKHVLEGENASDVVIPDPKDKVASPTQRFFTVDVEDADGLPSSLLAATFEEFKRKVEAILCDAHCGESASIPESNALKIYESQKIAQSHTITGVLFDDDNTEVTYELIIQSTNLY